MSNAIQNKYDFMIIYDTRNGMVNANPDSEGLPRMLPANGKSIVTDARIKRLIRDYVLEVKEEQTGYKLYQKRGNVLNEQDAQAYAAIGIENDKTAVKKAKGENPDLDRQVRDWMCANFWDIRTFGATMTTFTKHGLNCGQVRGPVQIGISESMDAVNPQILTISRGTLSTAEEAEDKNSTFGTKTIIPYALYTCKGHVDATLAQKTTGFDDDDLELLWQAIQNMFEMAHSASLGDTNVRKLVIFKHDSKHGNAPAWKLYDLVKITKKEGVKDPACFEDYTIEIDEASVPDGVSVTVL